VGKYCRETIARIASDENLSTHERRERVKRYLDAYLDLIVQMDAESCIHDATKVYAGVPTYIPDGFVDMGQDGRLQKKDGRIREKVIVNKRELFAQAYDVLFGIFSQPAMTQRQIVDHLYYYVGKILNRVIGTQDEGMSIALDQAIISADKTIVCRHKAVLFQVLAQVCGISSRLMKCDLKTTETQW
jgi:hypothetical protein